MRIHDETFPASGGAWFFKVDPHDDVELVLDFFSELGESMGVINTRLGIVNGAWAADKEHALVCAVENVADVLS